MPPLKGDSQVEPESVDPDLTPQKAFNLQSPKLTFSYRCQEIQFQSPPPRKNTDFQDLPAPKNLTAQKTDNSSRRVMSKKQYCSTLAVCDALKQASKLTSNISPAFSLYSQSKIKKKAVVKFTNIPESPDNSSNSSKQNSGYFSSFEEMQNKQKNSKGYSKRKNEKTQNFYTSMKSDFQRKLKFDFDDDDYYF
eukprot:403366719